ncbi:TPA: hypothetical protein ACNIQM_000771 [Citrobacter werkmanii]
MNYSGLAVKIEQLEVLLKVAFDNVSHLNVSELESLLGLACDLVSPIACGVEEISLADLKIQRAGEG